VIAYNTKDWFTFIFRFHKSDTFRRLLPLLFAIGLYSWLVGYMELKFVRTMQRDLLKNLTLLHSMLTFVISLLLVFRTNTAYERWWEGRKLWGSLVNSSRNLAIKLNGILPAGDRSDRDFFAKAIPIYAFALKDLLQAESTRFTLDEELHPEFHDLDSEKHMPNQIARFINTRIYRLQKEGKIDGFQLQTLIPEMQAFTDICGACERIKNTPIPMSYSIFIKKFIFFYTMTMPLGFVFSLGYYMIPVVIFVFYVLTSIELIAEEIEDPFGTDSNDLPLQKIGENIQKHVREILH
jgi:putative membrane protein